MFIAYKLDLVDVNNVDHVYSIDTNNIDSFFPVGYSISDIKHMGEYYKDKNEKPITSYISDYLTKDGTIDASKLEDDWFPKLQNKHVFLSHSHDDEDLAKGIAALLQKKGISVFIDSVVWNYCDELLEEMDEKYCKADDGNYDYKLRNYTTSHVHNMLGVALMKMMVQCECIIFLNTENAISEKPLLCGAEHSEQILSHTHSPWIYHEIQMMKYLQKKIPERFICEQLLEHGQIALEKSITKLPYFDYTVNLNNLPRLTWTELTGLEYAADGKALDKLYQTDASKKYIEMHYPCEWLNYFNSH